MKISKLDSFDLEDPKSVSEKSRLSDLIDLARRLPDPKNLIALRRDLGEQLRDAAKISSIAERLDSRKRRSAVKRLKAKISLVKSARGVDTAVLSREVVRLRRKRKQLENQLGLNDQAAAEFDF